jgi:hypothetical protein
LAAIALRISTYRSARRNSAAHDQQVVFRIDLRDAADSAR